jgi:hypothetical protein
MLNSAPLLLWAVIPAVVSIIIFAFVACKAMARGKMTKFVFTMTRFVEVKIDYKEEADDKNASGSEDGLAK